MTLILSLHRGVPRSVTLPETNSSPLKIGKIPKGNDRIPAIHFQVLLLLVSGRVQLFGVSNHHHIHTSNWKVESDYIQVKPEIASIEFA